MAGLPKYRGPWDSTTTQQALEGMDMPSWLAEALAHALVEGDWPWVKRQVERHATDAINEAHAARDDLMRTAA